MIHDKRQGTQGVVGRHIYTGIIRLSGQRKLSLEERGRRENLPAQIPLD